jgi:hypothetical protein
MRSPHKREESNVPASKRNDALIEESKRTRSSNANEQLPELNERQKQNERQLGIS